MTRIPEHARAFERSTALPVDVAEAFAWHARPGALQRLLPPWESVEVVESAPDLEVGRRVTLAMRLGPLRMKWVAEHTRYAPPSLFEDVQRRGPFATWVHRHHFEPADEGSVLRDAVRWSLPLGRLANPLGRPFVERRLDAMFRFRHAVTRADLALHQQFGGPPRTVAITGASGLVGEALAATLTTGGHRVIRLVRHASSEADTVRWDPAAEDQDLAPLEGVDAVVHLGGAPISQRWTDATKARIRASRVDGTRHLVAALARLDAPPKTFVCASAIGLYGVRPEGPVDERSPPADDFLARLVRDWEAAADRATDFGARVVQLRFGPILSPAGGMLAKLLTPFRMGVGGPVGSGSQPLSWISRDDAVALAFRGVFDDAMAGPYNAVAPDAMPQQRFAKTLGRVLRRPAFMPLPAPIVKLLFGEMGEALLLGGAEVRPARLADLGHPFRHPELEGALRHLLGR